MNTGSYLALSYILQDIPHRPHSHNGLVHYVLGLQGFWGRKFVSSMRTQLLYAFSSDSCMFREERGGTKTCLYPTFF